MSDWKERQRICPKCRGIGYVQSEMRHENGYQAHAWAALCECQPRTMLEIQEATSQQSRPKDVTE